MKKQTIAIDVDDVLVSDVLMEHLNRILRGQDVAKPYSIDDLMRRYDKTPEEMVQLVHGYVESEEAAMVEPVEEAVAALEKLKKRYELEVVTARPGIAQDRTKQWLKTHFPETFRNVHFANMAHEWGREGEVSKMAVCQKLGADYLIDDSLRHVTEVAACGIQGILFGNYPWNQTDKLPQNVQRVENWDEVLELLL